MTGSCDFFSVPCSWPAKPGLWTLDWIHGLDCGLRFGLDFGLTDAMVDDDLFQPFTAVSMPAT